MSNVSNLTWHKGSVGPFKLKYIKDYPRRKTPLLPTLFNNPGHNPGPKRTQLNIADLLPALPPNLPLPSVLPKIMRVSLPKIFK